MFRGVVIGNILCYSKKRPTYFKFLKFHIQRGKNLLLKSASLVAYQQSARSTSLEEPGVHCYRFNDFRQELKSINCPFFETIPYFQLSADRHLRFLPLRSLLLFIIKQKQSHLKLISKPSKLSQVNSTFRGNNKSVYKFSRRLSQRRSERQEDTIVLQAFSKFRSLVNCGGEADNLKIFLSIRHCSMNSCIFIYYQ